jgi:hypothetical protein
MSKIFTLACITLTSLISRAADNESNVTITNLALYDVQIQIDGRHYDDGNRSITLRHFPAGTHYLKIFRTDGGEKVLYKDSITIKPKYDVDIVINRFEKVSIDELYMNDTGYASESNDYYDRWLYRDNNYGDAAGHAMSRGAFYTLQDIMQQELSGTERLKLAKHVIDRNYLTAMQVKELVNLFSSTDRALELAQYAYPKTINKNEFFVVYAAFTRKSSRDKLMEFVTNYKE